LQTPVYAIYSVPTIVCAAILLTIRHLGIPLPDGWWDLFDAEWEDVWTVSGHIMRLYREQPAEKSRELATLLNKKDVRRWLEEHGTSSASVQRA
jgi:cyclin L